MELTKQNDTKGKQLDELKTKLNAAEESVTMKLAALKETCEEKYNDEETMKEDIKELEQLAESRWNEIFQLSKRMEGDSEKHQATESTLWRRLTDKEEELERANQSLATLALESTNSKSRIKKLQNHILKLEAFGANEHAGARNNVEKVFEQSQMENRELWEQLSRAEYSIRDRENGRPHWWLALKSSNRLSWT